MKCIENISEYLKQDIVSNHTVLQFYNAVKLKHRFKIASVYGICVLHMISTMSDILGI